MYFEPPKSPWQHDYDRMKAQALADRLVDPPQHKSADDPVEALKGHTMTNNLDTAIAAARLAVPLTGEGGIDEARAHYQAFLDALTCGRKIQSACEGEDA
jgi:hypothetical protein